MKPYGIAYIIIASLIPVGIFAYMITTVSPPEIIVPEKPNSLIEPPSMDFKVKDIPTPKIEDVQTPKVTVENIQDSTALEFDEAISKYKFIQKFDSEGNFIDSWGTKGQEEGSFIHPHGITVDSRGNVFVVDEFESSIQKFDNNGNFLTEWGSLGREKGKLSTKLEELQIDKDDNIFLIDYGLKRVTKFDNNGNFVDAFGSNGTSDGKFLRPWGIAFDKQGNFFVTDKDNYRISIFNSNGKFLKNWGENKGEHSLLAHLHGITIDKFDNVYVTDEGYQGVLKFDHDGSLINKWGSKGKEQGQFIEPHGIVTDSKGNVYVVDSGNTRIQKFTSNGEFLTQWGTQGIGDGQFLYPQDIAIDSFDNIYVSDQGIAHSEKYIVRNFLEKSFGKTVAENDLILMDPILNQEIVYSGTGFFSNMEFLDEENILVLDTYSGKLKKIKGGVLQDEPLLSFNITQGNERGLLGIESFHDAGRTFIFLYVTEADKDGEVLGNRLYSYELVNGSLLNPKILLNVFAKPGPDHNGGSIAIDPEKNVYVAIGDINQDNQTAGITLAQNLQGRPVDGRAGILRVSQSGQVVENGILGNGGNLAKYFAYGIRNSFGMSFDPLTGNLWDTENGPSYGDEINLVEPGFNSGWSKVMGFSGKLKNFDPNQLVNFDGNGIYSEPEFEWKETVAPTSIIFIPDDKLSKKYEGDMLVGSVNYGGRIFNFDLTSDRKELLLSGPLEDKIAHSFEELDKNLFATNAGIVTDMEIGPDGYLYILTHYSSKVLIIKIF